MMASIPNMRSTPLPVPAGKTGTAEAAPGDFAAQMPVPGGPCQPADLLPTPGLPVELAVPAPVTAEEGETGEAPEAKTETAKDDQPAPAVVIPFLPDQPAIAPQMLLPVSAGDLPPAPGQDVPVDAPAGKPARGSKSVLTLPTASEVSATDLEAAASVDTSRVEAAVKELLQRKQVLTTQVAAAPGDVAAAPAKAEAAPTPVQAQAPAKASPAPVAAPASTLAPLPVVDQAQPALAPAAMQAAPIRAEAALSVDGTRTADLAVERQLDLARDTEWLDRLARDIARAGANDQPLRFRLHPQTLGHLQVELQQGDRGTAVRMTVDTEAARQILADAQPRLAAEARAQGVRIAETHVDLSGSGRHAPGDQRRQDEARQTPFVRTAPGAGEDAIASARPSRSARLDRYA